MTMTLVQFPLGGFGSLSDMLGYIMEASMVQMFDCDPHGLHDGRFHHAA